MTAWKTTPVIKSGTIFGIFLRLLFLRAAFFFLKNTTKYSPKGEEKAKFGKKKGEKVSVPKNNHKQCENPGQSQSVVLPRCL